MIKRILPFLGMFFGSLCFGLMFIVIFINATEVDCLLQSNEAYACQLRTLFFGKYQISERKVEDIVDIKVVEGSCDDGCSYRAEFVTRDGAQVPLSEVWTDHDPVAKQVDAIHSQMVTKTEKVTYRAEPLWWVLYLVGGLTLMSLLLSPLLLRKR